MISNGCTIITKKKKKKKNTLNKTVAIWTGQENNNASPVSDKCNMMSVQNDSRHKWKRVMTFSRVAQFLEILLNTDIESLYILV